MQTHLFSNHGVIFVIGIVRISQFACEIEDHHYSHIYLALESKQYTHHRVEIRTRETRVQIYPYGRRNNGDKIRF